MSSTVPENSQPVRGKNPQGRLLARAGAEPLGTVRLNKESKEVGATKLPGVLQRDLSEGTCSRSASILRCLRALTRACSTLLIAACRWIIMTSVQAFPVQRRGYRPCSLCAPLYRERLVHRSPAPRDGGRARAGAMHREDV